MDTETRHQNRDPYQYEAAEAAGSQGETAGSDDLDIHGQAADRYSRRPQTAQATPASAQSVPSFLAGDQRPDGINVGDTERMISIIGGLALTLTGITRRSAAGTALTLAGAALLHRGASGHCALNMLLGRSSARLR